MVKQPLLYHFILSQKTKYLKEELLQNSTTFHRKLTNSLRMGI